MAEQPNDPRNAKRFTVPSRTEPWTNGQERNSGSRPTARDRQTGAGRQDPWQSAQRPVQQDPRQGRQQTARQNGSQNPYQGGQVPLYTEQPVYTEQPYNSGYGPADDGYQPPKKKSNALLIAVIVIAAVLALAIGVLVFLLLRDKDESKDNNNGGETVVEDTGSQQNNHNEESSKSAQQPAEPAQQPAEPAQQPAEPAQQPEEPVAVQPVTDPEPEKEFPLKRNGRAVKSISELSLYDVVTFGSYPQTKYGDVQPIRWYVVDKSGDKVTLLSVYGLDCQKFHGKNEEVTFLGSDIFKWLNEDFKERAFDVEECEVMASPVSLMGKEDAEKLPMAYRVTSSTEYAIERGANPKRCLWWVGDFYKTVEFVDYGWYWYDTSLASAAYCVNDAGVMSAYQVNFSGKVARPMVIIQF